nr:MAG TPA: hypothetical protein [Caudoviricetes sp.]
MIRMSNLIVNLHLPQLRMYPVPGVSSFRYERMVGGKWVECNHSRARGVVGVFNRRAKALCEKLTGSSKTTTVSPSRSSAGSQKRSVSSSCEKGIPMSALAHSISSNVSSGK